MDTFFWILIVAAVVAYLMSGGKRKRKQGRYRRNTDYQVSGRRSRDQAPEAVREEKTAERQLTTVRNNAYHKRSLMNKSEYAVFCKLEALLSKSHHNYRVFAQVSLGEILGSDDKQAYWAINNKRADFVIINRAGYPVAVVEYHGTGHYQGDASLRDAVKREACTSAGIAFIELPECYSESDIAAISHHLTTKAA